MSGKFSMIRIRERKGICLLFCVLLPLLAQAREPAFKSFFSFYRPAPKAQAPVQADSPGEAARVDLEVAGFTPLVLQQEVLKESDKVKKALMEAAKTEIAAAKAIEAAQQTTAAADDPKIKRNNTGETKEELAKKAELDKRKSEIKNWIREGFEESLDLVARSEREEIDMDFTNRFLYSPKDASPSLTALRTRQELVNYAMKFVGNPYVYGGTSLTNGTDCSGFTMSVFKKFGISLPRTSRDQALGGREVSFSNMKPGDLLFYTRGKSIGHVAVYIGDGKVVHASTKKTGIRVSKFDYRKPYKAVSYFN